MATQSFHYSEPMIPSNSEVELARHSLASLNLKKTKTVDISISDSIVHISVENSKRN